VSVLSGRGLCDKLTTRPEEAYRLWCFVVCDLENLKNEEAMTRVGLQRDSKKMQRHAVPDFTQIGPEIWNVWVEYFFLHIYRAS